MLAELPSFQGIRVLATWVVFFKRENENVAISSPDASHLPLAFGRQCPCCHAKNVFSASCVVSELSSTFLIYFSNITMLSRSSLLLFWRYTSPRSLFWITVASIRGIQSAIFFLREFNSTGTRLSVLASTFPFSEHAQGAILA